MMDKNTQTNYRATMNDEHIVPNLRTEAKMTDRSYLYALCMLAADRIEKLENDIASKTPTPPAAPDVAGLVERLRHYEQDYLVRLDDKGSLLREAADALARLAAERDALREALEDYVRLRDMQYPGPAPHEWAKCEERIDATVARAKEKE